MGNKVITVRLTEQQVQLLSELAADPALALASLAGLEFIRACFTTCESNPNTVRFDLDESVFQEIDGEGLRLGLKAPDIIRQRAGLPIRGGARDGAGPKFSKPKIALKDRPDTVAPATRAAFPAPAGRIEHVWISANRLEADIVRTQARDHGGKPSDAFRHRMGLLPLRALERPAQRGSIAVAFAENELAAIRAAIAAEESVSGVRETLPAFVRQLAGFSPEPATELRPKAVRPYTDSEWAAFLDGADLPEQPAPAQKPYNLLDLDAA
ncbi:hypothetical protein [Rhizobium oryzicola]|uniref:Uncharacterized protein n=1 Tax=Rhizobium oryzicola TaxID=1232668 RepID=A0ABT8SRP6_9HYPH|nr:hypothetical protein [Rhizobium oryzicola]MDO1580910.1 hypothetical protein [Rhizobium oryzicola]